MADEQKKTMWSVADYLGVCGVLAAIGSVAIAVICFGVWPLFEAALRATADGRLSGVLVLTFFGGLGVAVVGLLLDMAIKSRGTR